jgi:selenocysteine lyase/cysteine desulfurase
MSDMIYPEEEVMKLECQREMFGMDPEAYYLNCAAYSPLLLASKEAGIQGINLKMNPMDITAEHHFRDHARLRMKISEFLRMDGSKNLNESELEEESNRIATFPSVSYGLAIVAKNLHRLSNIHSKKNILCIHEEFPNDFYAFARVADELNLSIVDVDYKIKSSSDSIAEEYTENKEIEEDVKNMGKNWNDNILLAITPETALVVIPHVHWIYGVVYNLEEISIKCRECNTLLVIDGSQSIGALPFNIDIIQPDALIVATYKWMLGPYSTAFGYFNNFFDNGVPIEETWMNRKNSKNFSNLIEHDRNYRMYSQRYNMGEFSEFIHGPMLEKAIDYMISCGGSNNIYKYITTITTDFIVKLRNNHKFSGISLVDDDYRSNHLFGIILPPSTSTSASASASTKANDNENDSSMNIHDFAMKCKTDLKLYFSVRGDAIRISVNMFNDEKDLDCLYSAIEKYWFGGAYSLSIATFLSR